MALKIPAQTQTSAGYDQHLQSKPITGMVSVEKKEKGIGWGGVPADTETVVPGLFDSNGMTVTVEGSHTVNLGNYESAKIGVSITVPCSPTSLNEAYDWALGWCGERIQAEVNSAKGQ